MRGSTMQTNWYVITGAPCAGKTAVLLELGRRGFRIVPEAARAHIDERLAAGRSLEEIRSDIHAFEQAILLRKKAVESTLDPEELVIFDRGMPDSIAYYRIEGLDPTDAIRESRLTRYRGVFFFDRLDFRVDAVRSEDTKKAATLEQFLAESYTRLGYRLIRIPVLPVTERADRIVAWIERMPASI